MTIHITCAACGTKLKSKGMPPAGRVLKCPRCSAPLSVAGAAAAKPGRLAQRAGLFAALTASALVLLVLPGVLLGLCLSGGSGSDAVGPPVKPWEDSAAPGPAFSMGPAPPPPSEHAQSTLPAASLVLPAAGQQPGPLLGEAGPSSGSGPAEGILIPSVRPSQIHAGPFSGPYTYKNLSLYLIHGPDTLPATRRLLTLEEALQSKQATVQLGSAGSGLVTTVQNRSDAEIFVQAGDILKGAFQDQAAGGDYLVAPGASLAQTSYCVEHGRSGARGSEPLAELYSATEQLPGTGLRLGVYRNNQPAVWDGIEQLQGKLKESVGRPLTDPISPTSLQLTLENAIPLTRGYVQALSGSLGTSKDVVGVVVVVNGRTRFADQYASHALFQKMWPKLLRASAVAALAEPSGEATPVQPTTAELRNFVATETESAAAVPFSLRDPAQGNLVIHRVVLSK
jgi:hypothetical protein